MAARSDIQAATNDATPALRRELAASLTAVAAAAFTAEAEADRIGLHRPNVGRIVDERRSNSGDRIAAGLFEAGHVLPSSSLKTDLPWLFDLRNRSVHAHHAWTASSEHPTGIRVNPAEMTIYTAEVATRALETARAVMAATRQLPSVAVPLDPPWERE